MHNIRYHMMPDSQQGARTLAALSVRVQERCVMAKKQKQKTVVTLERHDCRWPIGDPKDADFHFCGERSLAGRPYCELHWRMAFQPPKSRDSRSVVVPTRRAA
jgi:hypothetical protein